MSALPRLVLKKLARAYRKVKAFQELSSIRESLREIYSELNEFRQKSADKKLGVLESRAKRLMDLVETRMMSP